MKVAEVVKPILAVEDEAIMRESVRDLLNEEGLAELDLWDAEGREIVEQIISSSPGRFPYYFKRKPLIMDSLLFWQENCA